MSPTEIIRLLLVEDQRSDYFLLERNLRETMPEIILIWARNYDEGVEALKKQNFDLAIVDYRLGLQNGLELISYINQNYPFTPALLLTGIQESTIDQLALKTGAYDYLAKDHYTAQSLNRSIRYAIEKSRVLKSLKESENKFKALFENSMEYVFLVEEEHRILDVNKAALKMFECGEKEKLIGRDISEYIEPKLFRWERRRTSEEVVFSIPWLNKTCFCILNISDVYGEGKIKQLVLHDITERKQSETKEKLLEKQVLTGKVARVIAHEIKNPLTNIRLSVLELRSLLNSNEENFGTATESLHEMLDVIGRNGDRINKLIEDLLNATKFDRIDLKELDIEELVSESLALIGDRVKLKDIQVEKNIRDKVIIKGDKEKLVIALLNILINAVEAVREKEGKLEITTQSDGQAVSILIADNGKGIPEENIGKLFEPFFTSKKGGTGLGLAAAYHIVIKHEGDIKVSSRPGAGTTFTVTLPLFPNGADA